MRLFLATCLVAAAHASLWLPFANFDNMIGTLKDVAFKEGMEDPQSGFSLSLLAHAGRELFNNLGKYLSSSLSGEESLSIAHGLRELFNVTSTVSPPITPRFTPRLIPVTDPTPPVRKFTFPYTTPYYPRKITTTPQPTPPPYTRPPTTNAPTTTRPPTTTTARTTTERTTTESPTTITQTTTTATTTTTPRPTTSFTTYSPVQIWPTRPQTTTTTTAYPIWPTTPRRAAITWRPVQPMPTTTDTLSSTTDDEAVSSEEYGTFPYETTTKDNIPQILKNRTRPPVYPKTTQAPSSDNANEVCRPGSRCTLKLRSFETSDPVFQYAYSHSTMIDDSMQSLLKDTQLTTFPAPLSWHDSVSPEVLQMAQTIMTLYRPSRCLVIGVFTGLGLLGIAEHVDSRGIVVALEHPEYASFWEKVGLKHAKKMSHAHISRIQVRSAEEIERSLARLAASEPNTFDFAFLDDFKRSNYLDDYEHAVRLLRSGGLLIINQALNGGGVLSGVDNMTPEDKTIRDMNLRIRQDGRVRASLLPFSGGTWLISKK